MKQDQCIDVFANQEIGGNKDTARTRAKLPHNQVSVLLLHVSMLTKITHNAFTKKPNIAFSLSMHSLYLQRKNILYMRNYQTICVQNKH